MAEALRAAYEQALPRHTADEFEPNATGSTAAYHNVWRTVPSLTPLPPAALDALDAWLLPIVEAWAGEEVAPLVRSAIWGVRTYSEGATLAPHVDRLEHAVSAIVQVRQDLEEDWPLMIHDHDGEAHEVVLGEGEMLLYESARLVHGRPAPLHGRGYSAIFAHYRQADDSRWEGWSQQASRRVSQLSAAPDFEAALATPPPLDLGLGAG